MASRARKGRKSVNNKGGRKADGAKGRENAIDPQAEKKPDQHGQDGPVGDRADDHRVEDGSKPLDGADSCSEPNNSNIVAVKEEAAVGSIHHILKTAFKELYLDADDGRKDVEQKAMTVNEQDAFGTTEPLQPCLPPVEAQSTGENGEISLDLSAVRRERRITSSLCRRIIFRDVK